MKYVVGEILVAVVTLLVARKFHCYQEENSTTLHIHK